MKQIALIAVVVLLAGCDPAISQEKVALVQKACSEAGLVSSVDRNGAGTSMYVTGIKCMSPGK